MIDIIKMIVKKHNTTKDIVEELLQKLYEGEHPLTSDIIEDLLGILIIEDKGYIFDYITAYDDFNRLLCDLDIGYRVYNGLIYKNYLNSSYC